MKDGIPINADHKAENIRKIRLNKKLPKKSWYRFLSEKEMLVYLFPGYKNAVSLSRKQVGSFDNEIEGDHFELVKYVDKMRNSDVRLRKR